MKELLCSFFVCITSIKYPDYPINRPLVESPVLSLLDFLNSILLLDDSSSTINVVSDEGPLPFASLCGFNDSTTKGLTAGHRF